VSCDDNIFFAYIQSNDIITYYEHDGDNDDSTDDTIASCFKFDVGDGDGADCSITCRVDVKLDAVDDVADSSIRVVVKRDAVGTIGSIASCVGVKFDAVHDGTNYAILYSSINH
jgi:hypothetical protein